MHTHHTLRNVFSDFLLSVLFHHFQSKKVHRSWLKDVPDLPVLTSKIWITPIIPATIFEPEGCQDTDIMRPFCLDRLLSNCILPSHTSNSLTVPSSHPTCIRTQEGNLFESITSVYTRTYKICIISNMLHCVSRFNIIKDNIPGLWPSLSFTVGLLLSSSFYPVYNILVYFTLPPFSYSFTLFICLIHNLLNYFHPVAAPCTVKNKV